MKISYYILALAILLSLGGIGIYSQANALNGNGWFWTYPSIAAGDCNVHQIKVTIFNDGSVQWNSRVSSSGSDDSAGIKGLSLIDNHGVTLWTFGDFWSPTISHNEIAFDNTLFYPAYLYQWIASPSAITVHC
jgi:hypothetical protein